MTYYTDQTKESGAVLEDADLEWHLTDEEATAAFQKAYDEDEIKIIGWGAASFGDCWTKLCFEPEFDGEGYTEVDGVKCVVSNPGTHPGPCKTWWCNPVDDVRVPVFKVIE